MTEGATYQVKELAHLTGVSVRALHHYHAIGLLVPSRRTRAGYRVYTASDVLRLQRIVVMRELGMSLESIAQSLSDPKFDERKALLEHRRALEERAQRTAQMLRAVDLALAKLQQEAPTMTTTHVTELFDGFDPTLYEEETKERWGDTDAYRESARRTKNYTRQDWERYKAESDTIMREAAVLFRAGELADAPAARAIAERHRLSIDHWFYPCNHDLHAGLADMYEADARFAASIDQYAPSLTSWWAAAIRANSGK